LAQAMARVDGALETVHTGGVDSANQIGMAKTDVDSGGPDAPEMASFAEPERAPRLINAVKPDYPSELRQQEMAGRVLVAFVVTREGRVTDVRVEQSANPAFDASAVAAVRQWRFEPARKGGVAIASRMRIPIAFRP
jgi:protein TonB